MQNIHKRDVSLVLVVYSSFNIWRMLLFPNVHHPFSIKSWIKSYYKLALENIIQAWHCAIYPLFMLYIQLFVFIATFSFSLLFFCHLKWSSKHAQYNIHILQMCCLLHDLIRFHNILPHISQLNSIRILLFDSLKWRLVVCSSVQCYLTYNSKLL